MTAARVGIDIVPLTRVAAILAASPEVLRRHLTAEEVDSTCRRGTIDHACVAGKLAAKEAVFKLFRRPSVVLPWRAIHITTSLGGWPVATLTGVAAAWAAETGMTDIDLSIAHDGDYAVATATAQIATTQTTLTPSIINPRRHHDHLDR